MALNSINTNVAAYYAQSNIGKASTNASLSVARLSSGSRIVRAADDVAALSTGTSLRTNVTTLRTALINTAQGASLLQVADGALAQITEILQRQKAIAVQAGSGSLSDTERGFLNQEFQQLTTEIDRLTGATNFSGVTLLDGSVFDKTIAETASSNAGSAAGGVSFLVYNAAGSININGVVFTSTATVTTATQFLAGTSLAGQLDNLVTVLNSSTNTAISGAVYSRSGNTLQITQRAGGGNVGRAFSFNAAGGYGAANVAVNGLNSATANVFYLQGGGEVGLGYGRTLGVGVSGDSLVVAQSQQLAQQTISYDAVSTANITTTFQNKVITLGGVTFNFTTTTAAATGIQISTNNGVTGLNDTLRNAVTTLQNYRNTLTITAANNDIRFVYDQLDFRLSGSGAQIIISNNTQTNLVTGANGVVNLLTNVTGASPTANVNFNNATAQGISTYGVTNADFYGTIEGFTATYANNVDQVNLSVTIGGKAYLANNVATNPTVNTSVRFRSTDGGFFDVTFAANQGVSVSDQTAANTIAARLDAAFSGISFYQTRNVTSYNGAGSILTEGVVTGSLTGSSVRVTLSDFSGDVEIQDVRVTAPASGTTLGTIEFTINGKTFRSDSTLSNVIGANGIYRFTSTENANEYVEFRAGTQSTFLRNANEAQTLEDALKSALGVGAGGVALKFQVGTTTEDTLSVSIGNATSTKLFDGQTLDVTTQANAATASDVIDDALNKVTSIRADVGALQSRFGYASSNIESSLQNQDAARGVLLDTDVAAESTAYATAQVQLQAGISVLAQANQLTQSLLKLIG